MGLSSHGLPPLPQGEFANQAGLSMNFSFDAGLSWDKHMTKSRSIRVFLSFKILGKDLSLLKITSTKDDVNLEGLMPNFAIMWRKPA